MIEAWKAWSEGIRNYISTNEDQYGPFRIGPSYPLVLSGNVEIPTVPYAMFGGNTYATLFISPVSTEEASSVQAAC